MAAASRQRTFSTSCARASPSSGFRTRWYSSRQCRRRALASSIRRSYGSASRIGSRRREVLTIAFGGLPYLAAEQAELNATTLYRTLSPWGNPELKSLLAFLKALGLRLAVQSLQPTAVP